MVLYYQVDQLHRVALPALIMLQNYEKYSILPNVFAIFFAQFFNFNNPPLLHDNAGLLTDKDGLFGMRKVGNAESGHELFLRVEERHYK